MFSAEELALSRSRITNRPTTATPQKTNTSISVAYRFKIALRMRSRVCTSFPVFLAASDFFLAATLFSHRKLNLEPIALVVRQKLIHTEHFDGVVDIA